MRAGSLVIALLALASPGRAQDVGTIPVDAEPAPVVAEDAVVLETIEVTASKRAKSQRDLPGSVQAVPGEVLEQMRANGLADYLKRVPGVHLADYGTGQQVPVIRGIASSTASLANQFSALMTGVFVDEIPFSDLFLPLSVPDMHPFDLERVEVLKGPQGTLFGSGAMAGAIRYIPRKPVPGLWEGKLATTVAQTETAESLSKVGAAAVNVPLGAAAALRLVGVGRDESGFYDARPNGENRRDEADIDRLDQVSGRALASWDVTDAWRISGSYFHQRTKQDDVPGANQPEHPERNDIPFPSPMRFAFGGVNLAVRYAASDTDVLYSAGRLAKDSYALLRIDYQVPNHVGAQQEISSYNLNISDINGETHELRVASPEAATGAWEWLLGVAYMEYRHSLFHIVPAPGPADSGVYADPPERQEEIPRADRLSAVIWDTLNGKGTERALFGEATRRLGQFWEVTAGLRAFETDLENETVIGGALVPLFFDGSTEWYERAEVGENGVNPRFALRYLHDAHLESYVLVARGFQFGGFQLNPPIVGLREGAVAKGFEYGPYKSSTLWNYEGGLRTEWLDRRLRFDLTGFYLDWTDLPLTINVPINPVPFPFPPETGLPQNLSFGLTVNVAAAHSEGIEAALEVVPFDGARFTSSAAWISARTDEPFDEDNPEGPVPAGTRLPGSPRFQWANVLGWYGGLGAGWGVGVEAAHAHVGTSPNALRPRGEVGGYDTIDVRFTLSGAGRGLPELGLGVTNLTDVRGIVAYEGDGSIVHRYFFVRPRTALLSLDWRY